MLLLKMMPPPLGSRIPHIFWIIFTCIPPWCVCCCIVPDM